MALATGPGSLDPPRHIRTEPIQGKGGGVISPLAEEDRCLAPLTQIWLATLPRTVRPAYLPMILPRVADVLASLWHDAPELAKYFWGPELAHDSRVYRALVDDELRSLHNFSLAGVGIATTHETSPDGGGFDLTDDAREVEK